MVGAASPPGRFSYYLEIYQMLMRNIEFERLPGYKGDGSDEGKPDEDHQTGDEHITLFSRVDHVKKRGLPTDFEDRSSFPGKEQTANKAADMPQDVDVRAGHKPIYQVDDQDDQKV